MDTIIFSAETVKKLTEWEHEHGEYLITKANELNNDKEAFFRMLLEQRPEPIMNEGVYCLRKELKPGDLLSYIDYWVTFKVIDPYKYKLSIEFSSDNAKNKSRLFIGEAIVEDVGYTHERVTNIKPNKKHVKGGGKMQMLDTIRDIKTTCAIFISAQYFINHKLKNREVVKKYIEHTPRSNDENSNDASINTTKEKATRVIDLEKMIQTIGSTKGQKEFIRRTDSWGVMGHYRHYRDKNGNITKTIFVKPYTKGFGKKSDKIYKVV